MNIPDLDFHLYDSIEQNFPVVSSNMKMSDEYTMVSSSVEKMNFSTEYAYSDMNFTNNTTENRSDFSPITLDNWWEVFDHKYLRHSLGWSIVLTVAYLLILVVGIVGNCMVIAVVVFRPRMRSILMLFILNLSVADLFVVVFCVPATLFANLFTPWILGSFMCKCVAYIQGVSVCASAYSLAAISLDRCKAIYQPLKRPRGLSKTQALCTICLIWITALLLTIPWAVIFNVIVSEEGGLSYCLETWKNEQHGKIYFLVANLFCCYCLPLVLISVSNVIIWYHVARRKVPLDSASVNTIKKLHRQTRHGVRKMLGIVTFTFLISWLPLYIIVTRIKFSETIGEDEENILNILLPLAQLLGSLNSSVNPVLYAFLNGKFREMFKSLLPAWMPFASRKSSASNKMLIRSYHTIVRKTSPTNDNMSLGTRTGSPTYNSVLMASNSLKAKSSSSNTLTGYSQHRNLLVTSSLQGERQAVSTKLICVKENERDLGYYGSDTLLTQTSTYASKMMVTITNV